jgi:hypothetical protein
MSNLSLMQANIKPRDERVCYRHHTGSYINQPIRVAFLIHHAFQLSHTLNRYPDSSSRHRIEHIWYIPEILSNGDIQFDA